MSPRCPRIARAALAALCFGASIAIAEAAQPGPPESRQFDFWLGEWEVTSPDGKLQGTNRIELVSDGRGLLETWTGETAVGNTNGRSLNAWNAEKKQWQQFWVGGDGGVLELSGGADAQGRMVLTGERDSEGKRLFERITWTPGTDGSVRQLWEQSSDAGKTWTIVFDGRYTKKTRKLAGGISRARAMFYLFQ